MKKWLFAIPLMCAPFLFGQSTPAPIPLVQPHQHFVDSNGAACAGCSLYSYEAGTTTPQPTYTDYSGTTQNTNPIVLDASGAANVWMGANAYKFILKDALGNTLWTVDQVPGSGTFGGGSVKVSSPAYSVQLANATVDGLTSDSQVTVDTTNHILEVGGPISGNHVNVETLSAVPATWTLDITSASTVRSSLGLGTFATQSTPTGSTQCLHVDASGAVTGTGADCPTGAITGLTGDGTATGPGSVALTLATVNSAPGACGDSTHVCQITTNGKGLVTAQSAVSIGLSVDKVWVGQTLCTPPTSTDGSCTGSYTFPSSFAFADTGYALWIQGLNSAGAGVFAEITSKSTTGFSFAVWCAYGCSNYGTGLTFDIRGTHP